MAPRAPGATGVIFRLRHVGQGPGDFEIMASPLPHGEARSLVRGVYAIYAPTGHLLVVTADGKLIAIPFDPGKLELTGAPIAHGRTMGFYAYGVRDGGRGRDAVADRLESVGRLVRQLIAEDAPVLDTIRFRPGVLVASDRHLARFFQYVRRFPRAHPPGV